MFDLEKRADQYEKGLAIAFGEDRVFPPREITKGIVALSMMYDCLYEQKKLFEKTGKLESAKHCLELMDLIDNVGSKVRKHFNISMQDPEPHKGAHSEVYLMTGRNRSRNG